MLTEKEKTAPFASVGADAEQSSKKDTTDIIPEKYDFRNPYIDDYLNKMNPYFLPTISMSELYNCVYTKKAPIIDGLLYPGAYLFVGAPKLGKSFFMAQLAYHVSTGTPLWNYAVRQGTVLYLALEDDFHRLQERLYRMFGTESTDKLHFSTSAKHIEGGLEEQIRGFIMDNPDTSLIIIDTIQKVRDAGGESYSYASDYEIITKLKKLADSCDICLLLVHHTRKQQDQKLYLNRNMEKLLWELDRTETDLWREPPEPLLEAVGKFVNEE